MIIVEREQLATQRITLSDELESIVRERDELANALCLCHGFEFLHVIEMPADAD